LGSGPTALAGLSRSFLESCDQTHDLINPDNIPDFSLRDMNVKRALQPRYKLKGDERIDPQLPDVGF